MTAHQPTRADLELQIAALRQAQTNLAAALKTADDRVRALELSLADVIEHYEGLITGVPNEHQASVLRDARAILMRPA